MSNPEVKWDFQNYKIIVKTDAGERSIGGTPTAAEVPVADLANYYTAMNVEDALAEAAAVGHAHVTAADPHTQYVMKSTIGQPNGVAPLDAAGKISSAYLSSIALTDVHVIGTEAEQLALVAQEGDVAVRTDLKKSFVHNGGTSGTMNDWQELLTPTDSVSSVFGRIGNVTAMAGDYNAQQVGAEPAGAVATHEGAADPHPQYLTQTEGDARYAPLTGGGGTGLTQFIEGRDLAAPNDLIPAHSLTPVGVEEDIDVIIRPIGGGALMTNIPDGTSLGGNKRGMWAVDLQLEREAATQVASGMDACIAGGFANTAGNTYSIVVGGARNQSSGSASAIVGGENHIASGDDAFIGGGDSNKAMGNSSTVVGGYGNIATAPFGTIGGGSLNIASGNYSTVVGGRDASTRYIHGRQSYAAGMFMKKGDAQISTVVQRRTVGSGLIGASGYKYFSPTCAYGPNVRGGPVFSADGTKVFLINSYGIKAVIYQYPVNTPFNLSTVNVYGQRVLQIDEQDIQLAGMHMSPDGTKIYVLGALTRTVFQYTLATAWDLTTASYSGKSYYLGDVLTDSTLQGFTMMGDGTKFYVMHAWSPIIYQFDLGTAWDISTASYANKAKDISAQDEGGYNMYIKPDGTKFYFVGYLYIFEYDLTTPGEISTATHVATSVRVSYVGDVKYCLTFLPDGSKAFAIGNYSYASQYTLTTAWSVAAFSSTTNNIKMFGATSYAGMAMSPNGLNMYLLDESEYVEHYTLGTAWDASTAVPTSRLSVSPTIFNVSDMAFSSDGTKMYVTDSYYGKVHQYTLGTPWVLSTATYANISYLFTAQITGLYAQQGIAFSPDGLRMFLVGNATVHQYNLGTAWNVSTAAYASKSFSVSAQLSKPVAVAFDTTGTTMYLLGDSSAAKIVKYTLSTAWDVSTASFAVSTPLISCYGASSGGLALEPTGQDFYVVGTTFVCQISVTPKGKARIATADGLTPSGINVLVLPDKHAFSVNAEVIARETTTNLVKRWKIEGVAKRGVGTTTVALVGAPIKTVIAADAGTETWDCDLVVSPDRGSVEVACQPTGNVLCNWLCKLETAELG